MLQGLPNLGPLKNYVELASGLTEVTANKAKDAVMSLIAQGMALGAKQPADVAASVQQAADDLMAMSKSNRDMLIDMIRTEVDRAVGRMGFIREDELAAHRARVEKLEKQQAEHAVVAPAADAVSEAVTKKKKVVVSE